MGSGYLMQSRLFGNNDEPAVWCEGLKDIDFIPKNVAPFTRTIKMNCPLVPPTPRWPSFISFCLPKPVSTTTKECPKEQYPEYNWNWDWQQWKQDSYRDSTEFNIKAFTKVLQNEKFDYCDNINPTNEIYSAYPWAYTLHDYNARNSGDGSNAAEYAQWLKDYDPNEVPYKCEIFDCDCWNDPKNKNQNGPHYPVNRYYIRSQAPFLQEIGWAFWDTEDDYDSNRPDHTVQYVIHSKTPTHMPVALQFQKKSWQCASQDPDDCAREIAEGGTITNHDFDTENENRNLELWEIPNSDTFPSFNTGGVLMQYCCTTISEGQFVKSVHTLHWPDGHLCIYAHGAIDSTDYQFKQGSVGWDCENGANNLTKKYGNKIYSDKANNAFQDWDDVAEQQRQTESLPAGLYHIQYNGRSDQYISQNLLCMKTNTEIDRDIELPRDVPFYMMMYIDSCQWVRGMFVTAVSLTWDTEDDHIREFTGTAPNPPFDTMFIEREMNSWGRATAYGRTDQLPEGYYSQEKIEIKYCFYQPNAILEPFSDGSGKIRYFDVNSADSLDVSASVTLDIRAMDTKGSYTVPWPLDESLSLCTAPTRAPIVPSPTGPPTTQPPTPNVPATNAPTRT